LDYLNELYYLYVLNVEYVLSIKLRQEQNRNIKTKINNKHQKSKI